MFRSVRSENFLDSHGIALRGNFVVLPRGSERACQRKGPEDFSARDSVGARAQPVRFADDFKKADKQDGGHCAACKEKIFRTASNCRIGRQLNPRLPRWWRMLTDQPRWQLAHYQFAEETGGPRAGLEDRSGAVGTGAPRTLFRGLSLPQRNVKIGVLQRFPR